MAKAKKVKRTVKRKKKRAYRKRQEVPKWYPNQMMFGNMNIMMYRMSNGVRLVPTSTINPYHYAFLDWYGGDWQRFKDWIKEID